jgi:hypothetical protein
VRYRSFIVVGFLGATLAATSAAAQPPPPPAPEHDATALAKATQNPMVSFLYPCRP